MRLSYAQGDDVTTIHNGDCIETMKAMPPESVDAIVTDPPYGLSNTTPAQVADTITKWAGGDRDHVPTGRGFMGKSWDAFVPPPAVWDECMRVLKPGGHMVVFAGSRTQDLMGLSIRLAGFEIRDSLAYLYGTGFPKSHDVSKAIDKAAGVKREVIGSKIGQPGYHLKPGGKAGEAYGSGINGHTADERLAASQITAPATPEAAQWDGWGTALKPGHEPIVLARKPLAEKTVARNVLAHGTGAINVDACRIEGEANRPIGGSQGGTLRLHGCHSEAELRALAEAGEKTPDGRDARKTLARFIANRERNESRGEKVTNAGRWPANVLLDQHAAAWVDEQSGVSVSKRAERGAGKGPTATYGEWGTLEDTTRGHDDQGGASRFFYTAKAPKSERPTYTRPVLRLRDNLTPEQADHVRARLQEAGISLD